MMYRDELGTQILQVVVSDNVFFPQEQAPYWEFL